MGKNRIKADMDIAKMAAQSLLALIFALVIYAITGKILSIELFTIAIIFALVSLVFFVRKFKYLGDELDKLEREDKWMSKTRA